MEPMNTGLATDQRTELVQILNRLLADEHVLYIKTRNYHWNIVGPRFHTLHVFFEEQYGQLAETIDEVAETARQFGGVAAGSMTEFLQQTRLRENPGHVPDEDGMLQNLLDDHEAVIRVLRQDVERAGSDYNAADAADFLTSVLEKHNKMAWMLRSFLASTSGRRLESNRQPDNALVGSSR